MDIEGTTTDINFVHQVLFPYSIKNMPIFLKQHFNDSHINSIISSIKEKYLDSNASLETVTNILNTWMKEDKKIKELKDLQGYLWKIGYEKEDYTSHIYTDVFEMFQYWTERNITLSIYSSGSVQAQKLLFKHTEQGNLNKFISHYFDTNIGSKKDHKSYLNILEKLNASPDTVLFLSDNEEEIQAATKAQIKGIKVVRDGLCKHANEINDFKEISF